MVVYEIVVMDMAKKRIDTKLIIMLVWIPISIRIIMVMSLTKVMVRAMI